MSVTDIKGREVLPGHLVIVLPERPIGDVMRVEGRHAVVGLLRRAKPGNWYPGWSIERQCWLEGRRLLLANDPLCQRG